MTNDRIFSDAVEINFEFGFIGLMSNFYLRDFDI